MTSSTLHWKVDASLGLAMRMFQCYLVLSRIDRFLFSVEWEGHFQEVHQVILPKITSDHCPILLLMGTTHAAKRPFKFENIWLEVDGFCGLVVQCLCFF